MTAPTAAAGRQRPALAPPLRSSPPWEVAGPGGGACIGGVSRAGERGWEAVALDTQQNEFGQVFGDGG